MGRPCSFVKIIDVTSKISKDLKFIKQAEQKSLIKQNNDARATLSHELKTPVESCIMILD